MGHCGEFGCSIGGGCAHPMEVNDGSSCICTSCGVVCGGRFPGCQAVWSARRTELPTAHERHLEFMALPNVGVRADDNPVSPPGELVAQPQPAASEGRPGDEPVRLEVALALQEAVNKELLDAIRRLERTVAELTAAPPALSRMHPDGPRRSVDVLQWVEPGHPRGPVVHSNGRSTTKGNGSAALARKRSTAGNRRWR